MKNRYDAVVIGAGPAGLIAAGCMGKSGLSVCLLEKNEKSGKKLRITGKGRCNITNSRPKNEFIQAYGKNGKFLYSAFSVFFRDELLDFFKNTLSIEVTRERGGRIFPLSQDAHEIADKLATWAENQGVEIVYEHRCISVNPGEDGYLSLQITHENKPIDVLARSVLIATGGISYPGTGSTGDGYALAKNLGHSIIPLKPALVPLITHEGDKYGLKGISIKNSLVTVLTDGKKSSRQFGEFLFTHFGVSGPVILTLSKDIVNALNTGLQVLLHVDFKPALDENTLDKRLIREFSEHSNKCLKNILRFIIPEALGTVCLAETGVSGDIPCHSITSSDRKKIGYWLKNFEIPITGYRPIEEAIVTSGGINLKEIEPATMQSKINPRVYFAGEILDLDGDTGGYNLQAAFSTGWCAAKGIIAFLTHK